MLFDINAPVDLGSKAITHSLEEQKFAVKNSLPFNGLLSNYHAITNKGCATTNGEQLSLESLENKTVIFKHRNKEYKIENAKQVLASKTEIKLPYDEEIKDYYIGNKIYIRTEEHIFSFDNNNYNIILTIDKDENGKYKSCFFTTKS